MEKELEAEKAFAILQIEAKHAKQLECMKKSVAKTEASYLDLQTKADLKFQAAVKRLQDERDQALADGLE